MRLGDLDALREELLECAAEGQLTEREARAILNAAPTVSCGECAQWKRHRSPNVSGWGTCRSAQAVVKDKLFPPPDFCCSYFERVQP